MIGFMKKGHKFIRGLEITAIIILILSFITLAYCVYISIMAEKEYEDNYSAEKTSLQTDVTQNEGSIESNISDIIEKVNNAVVGISRVKNTGSTMFRKSWARYWFYCYREWIYSYKSTCFWR